MNNERESDLTIPYVKVGDYFFPNFALPPDAGDIGFWGRRRREFLREHRPVTFNQLVLSGELFKYLALFNQEATERLESLIQAMKVTQGITEELKGRDQMAWVGAMNPSAIPGARPGAGFAPLLQAIATLVRLCLTSKSVHAPKRLSMQSWCMCDERSD